MYELKEDKNKHLGIISELFFYSCLMSDFKKIAPDKGTDQRGFSKFLQANNKIKAFFLAPSFHSFIDGPNLDNILTVIKDGLETEFEATQLDQAQNEEFKKYLIKKMKEEMSVNNY